jgi:hypothetical protein
MDRNVGRMSDENLATNLMVKSQENGPIYIS